MNDTAILRPGAVALVTGASAGIGGAVAEALSARGARVICAARRLERLRDLVEALSTPGLALELDVADGASTRELIERLPADWRQIDILVNNAGHDLGGRSPFQDREPADIQAVIETNVAGLLQVTRAVLPGMHERGRGHIVNVGSVNGFEWAADSTVYVASKFAVHGFTASLRQELTGSGLRVSEIMPGTVRTEFAAARWRGDEARAGAFYESRGAVLSPVDVAEATVFVLERPPHVNISDLVLRPA
ncbi:MAG: SDR family NAD(P)-dependent oxidoreductase [Alphaproteobacteria bacterium]|jgi:NADP-dependent 3-hydroxy acid dehydrogenase YdfG|nr:SDR family NAD(P)-dependent oxidoreductase [Alphaproteobacteria bacterium]MDP6566293.1 SDR family NAD(P)-dependent oxidoreductase [Alphaproteobacteria bacterium]MDP6815663.1 SDR family NAD(P)-dependent oxidoreductase [Alphaproteobacteria bacterium]